jgi:glycosyltransferase involved in cell wall biosynthesis
VTRIGDSDNTMTLTTLAAVTLVFAAVPALLFAVNVWLYRRAPAPAAAVPAVSVLIPARNEAHTIDTAVEAVLASRRVEFELIVLDDHSEDATAAVAAGFAARDGRVYLIHAPPLPGGWCGKQHACHVLARHASYPLLAFVDADVRLAPDALARLAAHLDRSGADLVSGIPRQVTGTLAEKLIIPLVHVLLLGYLPLAWMRRTRHPAFGAGCGQLFVTRRDAYEAVGGHAAIRASLHDGLTLPRAYRRAGRRTDLCDATDLATCRMYRSGRELWYGLAKNAGEGLAHPKAIVPWTLLLFGGHVLPFVLLTGAAWLEPRALVLTGLAAAAAYYPRLHAAVRFRQSWLGALLHPLGVLLLLAIQWYAFGRALAGRPVGWKGRGHPQWSREPVRDAS